MELANRKSLFRILSFLDGKLPFHSQVYSVVNAALLPVSSTNPRHHYLVYFEQNRKDSSVPSEEDDYIAIIGAKLNILTDSTCKNGKVWRLSVWAIDDLCFSEAIGALKEINWNEDYVVVGGKEYQPDPHTHQLLKSKRGADLEKHHCMVLNQFYLPMDQALNLRLSMPNEVYVKTLEHFHAQIVYDHWEVRKSTSVDILIEEIKTFPTSGVFLKATNELVSWMMYFPTNGMSRLHTLETHRGKGYGSLAVRYLSKRVAQSGYLPTANVNIGNEASLNLFKSIGFQLLQSWHAYHLYHYN